MQGEVAIAIRPSLGAAGAAAANPSPGLRQVLSVPFASRCSVDGGPRISRRPGSSPRLSPSFSLKAHSSGDDSAMGWGLRHGLLTKTSSWLLEGEEIHS